MADPLTLTTAVITIAGAVCKSYDEISKIVTLVRQASKEVEGIQSRASSINSIVLNLKQALEEATIRDVIGKDALALQHVEALDQPLKATQSTLEDVLGMLNKQYKLASDGKTYKVRWQYYLNTSDWVVLQSRLRYHIQVLGTSMQGLNTLHVLRLLGESTTNTHTDPARTLRTYAESIRGGQDQTTLIGERTPSPLPHPSPDPLGLDERRLLARKKLRLQREILQASKSGDYLDVSILLGEGVEVDWMDESEGMTALHLAAQYGHLKVAEQLLEAGADVEARSDAFGGAWFIKTEKGRTPLLWAAAGRECPKMQERMCRLLVEKGADVNARNDTYRTSLQEAAMSVRYHGIDPKGTMELLLKSGAHVNAFDSEGWTALTECGLWGRKDVADLLIAHGARVDADPSSDDPANASNPDLGEKHVQSPLVVCGEWSWNEDLIRLLLEEGSRPWRLNKDGVSLNYLAQKAGKRKVLEMLASNGPWRTLATILQLYKPDGPWSDWDISGYDQSRRSPSSNLSLRDVVGKCLEIWKGDRISRLDDKGYRHTSKAAEEYRQILSSINELPLADRQGLASILKSNEIE